MGKIIIEVLCLMGFTLFLQTILSTEDIPGNVAKFRKNIYLTIMMC
jgi:hypothetical protein